MLVEVWDRANGSKLADIAQLDVGIQRSVQGLAPTGAKLNEPGSGGFAVMSDHPEVAEFVGGRTVRMYDDDGVHVHTWSIDRVRTVHLAEPEREVVTVEGDGLLGRLKQGVVYPWLGNTGRPVSQERIFNWASPELDDSGWGGVYIQPRNFPLAYQPEHWPNTPIFGYYINTRAYGDGQHPVGDTLFREHFTLDEDVAVAIFISADDTFELVLDGVTLEREPNKRPDNSGNESTWRYLVEMTAGEHLCAIKLTNWDVSDVSPDINPSAVIVAAWPVSSGGVITDVPIFTSSADTFDWLGLDYPAVKPGFTAPEIIDILLGECQDRDELLGWTVTVHGAHEEIEEFGCRVGDTLFDVVEALAASYIDVEADLEGLVLHVYPKGELGSATDVEIVEGVNLEYLSDTLEDEFFNLVLGVWSEGVVVRSDATSIVAHGVRPTSLQIGNVTSLKSAEEILDGFLAANSEPLRQIVAEVVPSPGATAGVDFRPGDTVAQLGHLEDVKCVGVTWTLDQWGLLATPEFDTLTAVRQREEGRAVDLQIEKFRSPATASILAPELKIANGKVAGESISWSWAGDIDTNLSDRDDPEAPWQPWSPPRLMRISDWEVKIKDEDLPDATGDSIFELYINGTPISGLLNLTLTTLVAKDRVWVSPFDGLVGPNDEITVACTTPGNHVDGTITVRLADAV